MCSPQDAQRVGRSVCTSLRAAGTLLCLAWHSASSLHATLNRRNALRHAGKLLCLARHDFAKLLGDLKQLRHTWRFEALRRVPLLQQLSHAARSQLCEIFQQVAYPPKGKVVAQGEPGDAFYIVETGILAVVKDGKPVMRLSPGQVRSGWVRACVAAVAHAGSTTLARCASTLGEPMSALHVARTFSEQSSVVTA